LTARFQRSRRLLNAADYRRVFSAPDWKTGQAEVLLLARRSSLETHRLGLAIAKKHVPTAVRRNLLKRLARERFRTLQSSDPKLDIVVLTRPAARTASRENLRNAIDRQFDRLNRKATDEHTA